MKSLSYFILFLTIAPLAVILAFGEVIWFHVKYHWQNRGKERYGDHGKCSRNPPPKSEKPDWSLSDGRNGPPPKRLITESEKPGSLSFEERLKRFDKDMERIKEKYR